MASMTEACSPNGHHLMGFRGVLLSVREGEASAVNAFRVVCPDALLQLPTAGVPRDAPHVVEQKMLVTDFVTAELQQVTRLSGVMLQRETRSALWAAMAPAKLPVDEALGSAFPFAPQSLVRRVCYCFYFRDETEYGMFADAHRAAQRLVQYSLLEKSLRMEIEIQRDLALKPKSKSKSPVALTPREASLVPVPAGHAELKQRRETLRKELTSPPKERLQAQAIRAQAAELAAERAREEAKRAKENGRREKADAAPAAAKSPAAVIAEQCIMCDIDSTYRGFAGTFVNHPYLLKDGRGASVKVCKVCLQRVLQKRARVAKHEPFEVDILCGLCADSIADAKGDTKACSHPQCPRVYCSSCLKKLFGKAQVQKVWRTKRWYCPNCEPLDEDKHAASEMPKAASSGKKKRKRLDDEADEEIDRTTTTLDFFSALAPMIDMDMVVARDPETGSVMTPLDYAATYYQFLMDREAQFPPPKESEDVCFCCKDGGNVLECDWKHGGLQCPKVYHEDCLGFKVKENVEWLCPRHRCFKCGFAAKFACRLCVTSFCMNDMPPDTPVLGEATAEIEGVQYVICPPCDEMTKKAKEKNKISQELYERLMLLMIPRDLQQLGTTTPIKQKKRR